MMNVKTIFEMSRGVDTSIWNHKKQAPIHLATELNKVEMLKIMTKYKGLIDPSQGGEHGRTALHIAAIHDYDECARILVSHTLEVILMT